MLAKADGQLGIAHTSWNEGIESWRFGFETEWRASPTDAHTIFDRTLLRAGDTVHMKHVLRRPVLAGFAQVPPEERPEKLEIAHLGSDDTFETALAWDANGSAVNEWKIPKQAKLGSYSVRLVPREASEYSAGLGHVPRRGVPRAADARRALAAERRRWWRRASSRSTSPCNISRAAARRRCR